MNSAKSVLFVVAGEVGGVAVGDADDDVFLLRLVRHVSRDRDRIDQSAWAVEGLWEDDARGEDRASDRRACTASDQTGCAEKHIPHALLLLLISLHEINKT